MSQPASFKTDQELFDKQQEATAKLRQKTQRTIPSSELDAMFLTIDPDYQSTIDAFPSERYALILKTIKSGFRLGNITPAQASLCEYDFQTASELFDLGLEKSALAFLSDIVGRLEFSQSKKGFRSQMIATIRQELVHNQPTRKNVFGGEKKDE